MWLKELQIAVIEKNIQKIDNLLDTTPNFEKSDEVKQAAYLLREALELLYTLKDETARDMQKLKKHIDFMDSTKSSNSFKLDIKS
jgi:hypothetical protein